LDIVLSIVSHRQAELVKKLLQSIDEFLISKSHKIILMVTENTDSNWYPSSRHFEVIFVRNIREKGFGENHNKAFEYRNCDYFFIVNPDIQLFEKLDIDEIIGWMSSNKIGIASPIVVDCSGIIQNFLRYDLKVFDIVFRKRLRASLSDFDWIAGMFLMTNSADFRRLGGFDPRYFMYVEDCDLCMAARAKGVNLSVWDKAKVIHNARRDSRRKVRYLMIHIASIIKYLKKRFRH